MSSLEKSLEGRRALAPAQQSINNLQQLLEHNKNEIAKALPAHLTPERFARLALTLVRTTPKLLECSAKSIMGGIMMAAQLGLELGVLGQAYLVPFKNEAVFVIGYRGMIELARRSGNIKNINAHQVYAGDDFKLQYGLDEKIEHVPYFITGKPKGEFLGVYCVAKFVDGGHSTLYMPKDELDAHRQRSKASGSGPWVTDYEQMCLKTVVRGLFKWLPVSVEQARQVAGTDETAKHVLSTKMEDEASVIDNPDLFAQAEVVTPLEENPVVPPVEPVTETKKPAGLTVAQSKIAAMPKVLRDSATEALGIKTALWQLTDAECVEIEEKAISLI